MCLLFFSPSTLIACFLVTLITEDQILDEQQEVLVKAISHQQTLCKTRPKGIHSEMLTLNMAGLWPPQQTTGNRHCQG